MTIHEFEAWVSDNYEELVKLAKHVAGPTGQDLLHDAIEGMCEGREQLPPFEPEEMGVGVFAKYLINDKTNASEAEANRAKAMGSFATSFTALGDDVFVDTNLGNGRKGDPEQYPSEMGKAIRARKRREAREARAKKSTTEPAYPLNALEWTGFPRDGVRWRKQQLRDNKLFDQRAVKSLRASIRGVSARYRHFHEFGVPYTQFGQESAR